jgi:hypothetical protein
MKASEAKKTASNNQIFIAITIIWLLLIILFALIGITGECLYQKYNNKRAVNDDPKITSYEYNAKNAAIKAALEMMNPLLAQQIPDWNQNVVHVHDYDDFKIYVLNRDNDVTIKIIRKVIK